MKRKRTQVEEFDANRVRPMPNQPRKRFAGIRELADSIEEIGQATPGIVMLIDEDPKFDAQLIDGERRLRACKLIGAPFRAEIRPAGDIEASFAASFAANFGKQEHDAIEIAEALRRMQAAGKTPAQIARIAGKSEPWVYSHLGLLKLHPAVQKMMIADDSDARTLTFQLAQLLVTLDESKQLALANKITRGEGMGLAAARRFILKQRHRGGDKTAYLHHRGPRNSLGTMSSIIEAAGDRLGIYFDMPPSQFRLVADQGNIADRIAIIEQIEDLIEHLGGLAELIQAALPKAKARA
jgi:ParB/RepB/Spo0J family partition protein